MDINYIKQLHDSQKEGEWVDDLPMMGNLRLRVRSMNSPEVYKLQGKLQRNTPDSMKDEKGNINEDYADVIMSEVAIEAVLLDWENVTDNGDTVPYSKDKAREWLQGQGLSPFLNAVYFASQKVDQTIATRHAAMVGNLNAPLPSNSKTTRRNKNTDKD
jgi:hypothetical protein